MKHIIHDWDDERALKILGNIKRAMKPGGRVILLESVLTPPNQPDFGKLIDLEMLLMPGGRERTAEEYAALFERRVQADAYRADQIAAQHHRGGTQLRFSDGRLFRLCLSPLSSLLGF